MSAVRRSQIVVVGAGVTGAATAYALSRRGDDVTLLEQFAPGHRRGSSHGRSRIFRLSYPDPRYVVMAQEALPLWRRLEGEHGAALLLVTGGFDVGPSIEANARALGECGVAFELLAGRDAARRFPAVRWPADCTTLYQRDGAAILADRAHHAFLAGARARHDGLEARLRPTEPRHGPRSALARDVG